MMTRILSGDALNAEIKKEVMTKAEQLAAFGNPAKMAAVFVGEDPASRAQAHAKVKLGSDLFISVELHELAPQTSANSLAKLLRRLSNDSETDGVYIESPLPPHLNEIEAIEEIDPDKDVSGLHPYNLGKLLAGEELSGVAPVVPQACLCLLTQELDPAGRRAVVIGGNGSAARPLLAMLANRGAVVTLADPKTTDLAAICREAEIVLTAANVPALIKPEMIGAEAVVIDAGLTQFKGEFVGDADYEALEGKVRAISPVPGGVDRLTSMMLFRNLVKVAARKKSINYKT